MLLKLPAVKKLITKSSILIVKASNIPDKIPDLTGGMITFIRALNGEQPKSTAASNKLESISL